MAAFISPHSRRRICPPNNRSSPLFGSTTLSLLPSSALMLLLVVLLLSSFSFSIFQATTTLLLTNNQDSQDHKQQLWFPNQQQQGNREWRQQLACASSLPPGSELCEVSGAHCFDLFDPETDALIQSGCSSSRLSTSSSAPGCASTGCFLLPNGQKFVCCCANPFCNGKSTHLLQARWRMFTKKVAGTAPKLGKKKIARDLSRELASDHAGNGTQIDDSGGVPKKLTKMPVVETSNGNSTGNHRNGTTMGPSKLGASQTTTTRPRAMATTTATSRPATTSTISNTTTTIVRQRKEGTTTTKEQIAAKSVKKSGNAESVGKKTSTAMPTAKMMNLTKPMPTTTARKKTITTIKATITTRRPAATNKTTGTTTTTVPTTTPTTAVMKTEATKERKNAKTTNEKKLSEESRVELKQNGVEMMMNGMTKIDGNERATTLIGMERIGNNEEGAMPTTTTTGTATIVVDGTAQTDRAAKLSPAKGPSSSDENAKALSSSRPDNANASSVGTRRTMATPPTTTPIATLVSKHVPNNKTVDRDNQLASQKKEIKPMNEVAYSNGKLDQQQRPPTTMIGVDSTAGVWGQKRTTRSPVPFGTSTTTAQQQKQLGTDEQQQPIIVPFPWYFVALAGFLISSLLFLLVYWSVMGCRRIFSKQRQRRAGRAGSTGTEEEQDGEPMIPMGKNNNGCNKKKKTRRSNGAKEEEDQIKPAKNGKRRIVVNGNSKKNTAVVVGNGNGPTQQMSSKTTNDSLMSQCTAVTTASATTPKQQHDMDMEFMDGEKVTVIDPLLNQQWTGTLNK